MKGYWRTETAEERAKRARYVECPKCKHNSLMTHDDLYADRFNPGVVQITYGCSCCGKLVYEVVPDWRTRGQDIDVPVALLPQGLWHLGQPYALNPYWRRCTVEEVGRLFEALKSVEVGG